MTLDLKMPGMGGIARPRAGEADRPRRRGPDHHRLRLARHRGRRVSASGPSTTSRSRSTATTSAGSSRRGRAPRRRSQRMKAAPEQFLSTLSHEFRTPAQRHHGLLDDPPGAGPRERSPRSSALALDRIQSNSTSLLAYVETIFYMAELDRGLVPVRAPARSALPSVLGRIGRGARAARRREGHRLPRRRARGPRAWSPTRTC